MNLQSFLILVMVGASAHWVWDAFFRRIRFWQIGMGETVQVLQWLPDAEQERLYERGWVTKFQWYQMRRRLNQQIARDLEGIGFM